MANVRLIALAFVFGLASVRPATAARRTTNSKKVEAWKSAYVRPTTIPHPESNAHSGPREVLGRTLFFDPRLSGSNWISCATCHNPALSYGDGLPTGIGDGMGTLERRTPTVLNLAWASSLMWDGREATLESQALGPVEAAVEMNLPIEELEAKIAAIGGYAPLFRAAYPDEPVGRDTIAKAIAVFERTVVSGMAPFDAWIDGDNDALSAEARRGFEVFHESNCHECHSDWRFTDDGYYDIGLNGEDVGRGAIIPVSSVQHAFKTPTLRDVERRGPYMHDGSLATLADVVDFYNRGGDAQRPSQSSHVAPLKLSDADKQALVHFLKSLTGPTPPVVVPELPR